MMKQILSIIAFVAMATSTRAQEAKILKLASPQGKQCVQFYQKSVKEGVNELYYQVQFEGKEVIKESLAGLDLDNRTWEMALGERKLVQQKCWMDNFVVDSVTYQATVNNTWTPLYGERSTVRDYYNGATMYLSKRDQSNYRLNLEVRAYEEGVAFRYFFPEHPKAIFHKVVTDLTEYTLPEGTEAYAEEWAQAFINRLPIDQIQTPVERALTMELPNGVWASLMDADVDDWCLTKLVASKTKKNTLTSVMYSPVDIVTYYATPWKIIMAANKPTELLGNNDIIQNLNPPCEIENPDWVKPGTIMRCTKLTTEAGMKVIDFCAAHNIPYMLYDWQWYMPCTSHDGDAMQIIPQIDMPKVIAYGKEKGVGIWLYVNQHALAKQMHTLFPFLKEMGIVGVKSGFVQYASHRWAVWMHDMVRLASDNQLLMNIHDEYRASGFSRTYPNLLTQEGICGNEEWPDATHNVTLPFTRMINGAADYTICYFDKRLKNSHAHQLAASLVFYSPLQTILWYDTPDRYNGEPEMEWFDNLATVFDDSKVLEGMPGKHITMARRKGKEWFVGAMTNNDGSTETVNLSFLNPNETYLASIYTDGGEAVKTNTQVKCSYLIVNSTQSMTFTLLPRGGAAIRFVPISTKDAKGYKKYRGERL